MEAVNEIKWILILNPQAGGGKGRRDRHKIEKMLKVQGFHYELLISEYSKHAISLSKSAVEKGARHILIVGGDGTLNEVVNGVFQQNVCLPEKVTIGMIPVGTGNDWIKTFGIPGDYLGAITKIREGKILLQDVGKLTFSENGKEQIRYFSNMAGFGFDALGARKANLLKAKGWTGTLVYLLAFLSAYLQYQTRKVKISIDGKEIEDFIFTASIGIGKYNGGGMMQAPNAVPDNGIFEVTYIKRIGIWGIIINLAGLYNGSYVKDIRVVCNKAKQIFISSGNQLAGEIDGEPLGENQFHIEIIPGKLQVIVGEIEK